MKSGIYIIKNLINDKVYVGKSKNINQRKNTHFNALRLNKHSNQHLQNSYNKYGKDNFEFSVLEYCDESLLSIKEMYYIELYKNNYNIIQSIDNRQNFSQEMRHKMRQSKITKGLTVSIYSYNTETQEIIKWDSIKECAKKLNLVRRSIQKSLKRRLLHKNFRFSFDLDFSNYVNTTIKAIRTNSVKVYVYSADNSFISEYTSKKLCSEILGINRSGINRVINTNKQYYNLRFYSYKLNVEEESSC